MTTTIIIMGLLIVINLLLTYSACINLKKSYRDWRLGLLPMLVLTFMTLCLGLVEMQNYVSINELISKLLVPVLIYNTVCVGGLVWIIFLSKSKSGIRKE